MTDVQSEGGEYFSESETEELPPKKSKLSGKLNDSLIEKCSVKRTKKHKPRMKKRKKIVQPRASAVSSDYVSSSNRLTRRIGLFSNGKTSTKVSRLEYVASAETKARAEQDLQKLLNLACNSHVVTTENNITEIYHDTKDISSRSRRHSCQHKSDHEKKNQAIQSDSPLNCDVTTTYQNSRKALTSSDKNKKTTTSPQTKGLRVQKKSKHSRKLSFEIQSAVAILSRALNKKREELFPHVSLKQKYKRELAALQKHFSLLRAEHKSAESQSSSACNSNSLQPTNPASPPKESNFCSKPQRADHGDSHSAASSSFKLNFNPEPVPYLSPMRDWLFSDAITENEIFKNQELQVEDLDYRGSVFDNLYCSPMSPYDLTSDNCASLASASPTGSDDGQRPWKLPFSPFKPPVESPTPSWKYSRCKMF